MIEHYTCGHIVERDEETEEYINGSYALWEGYDRQGDLAICYGVLCNDCIPLYNARKCKIGGVE